MVLMPLKQAAYHFEIIRSGIDLSYRLTTVLKAKVLNNFLLKLRHIINVSI